MSNMYAVFAEAPGGPDVLRFRQKCAVPRPKVGEIQVRVAAAGINPIDCARRSGYGRRMMTLLGAAKFPLVLGNDFVGVVSMIGPGSSGFKVGQWVFGCKGASRFGTHAEFATIPAVQVLPLPGTLTIDEAAALPYSFVTAYRLITAGIGWKPADCRGRQVLVHGGLGAVGSLAVSLLNFWGAIVDVSHRSASPEKWRQLGAADAFNISASPKTRLVGKYDAIVNCAQFQNEEALFPLLRPGGAYATIVHPLINLIDQHGWIKGALAARSTWRKQAGQVRAKGGNRYRWVLFRPEHAAFTTLSAMAALSLLKPTIAGVYDVQEAEQAHRQLAGGGGQGKVILRMS